MSNDDTTERQDAMLERRGALEAFERLCNWYDIPGDDDDVRNPDSARADVEIVRQALSRTSDEGTGCVVPEAVRQIIHELAKAREKFPQWPDDPIHAAAVVQEEAGELVQATLQSVYEPDKADYSHAQREAIQLGAMAVRFLENMEAYRTPPRHQHDDRAIAEQGGQRVPEAPTDNGIPKLDSLCEQYNNGDLDLCALVCRVWNRAIAQSEQGSER